MQKMKAAGISVSRRVCFWDWGSTAQFGGAPELCQRISISPETLRMLPVTVLLPMRPERRIEMSPERL